MPTHSRSTHQFIKLFIAAGAVVALALPASAFGQATRTWVSGVGDDANPCSRTAPCKTFAGAISKTATKGEINVLDPGGFGGVTITKAITLDGEATEAGVLVSGTNAIVINAPATDTVNLKGLDVNGIGTGLNGIRVIAGKRVKVQNSKIYGFVRNGIDFESSTNNARLVVQNTRIHDNLGNGVLVAPPGSNQGFAVLRHVASEDNGCGVAASRFVPDPAFNFGVNCGVSNAGTATAVVNLFHSAFNDNGAGVFSRGSTAFNRLSDNEVVDNGTGLLAVDAGSILSWKNNFVDGNGTNGAPTGTINPVKKSKRSKKYHR